MLPTVLQQAIEAHHKKMNSQSSFIPGVSLVPVSGKVFDEEELMNGVVAVLVGKFFGVDRRFQFDYIRIEVFFL